MSFLQIPIQIYPITALGYESSINGSGPFNSSFGYWTLKDNTTGGYNTSIGYYALNRNTTGNRNIAIGSFAMGDDAGLAPITCSDNIAIGVDALRVGDGGSSNIAIGNYAMSFAGAGQSSNIGIGHNALLLVQSGGGNNVAVGSGAGRLITTGTNNVILGNFNGNTAGVDIRTASNYVVIADGNGNPRIIVDPAGLVSAPGGFSGGGGGGGTLTFNNRTAAYTVVSGDLGKIVNCTSGTFTVSLTAAATLGSGFNCWVWNTGTGVITIDPSGAETIDGVSTLTLRQGEGSQIVCNGTNWETGDRKTMRGYAENITSSNTRPIASGSNSVALGTSGVGPATASGSSSVAIGTSTISGSSFSVAIGFDARVNTGDYSVAIGASSAGAGSRSNTSANAMSLGGSYASGTDSLAAAIADNTSTYGARSTGAIAIGNLASSSATYAIAFGQNSNSTGSYSISIGGSTSASGTASAALGFGSRASEYGKFAYAAYGGFGNGVAQFGMMNVVGATTDATPKVLTAQNGAAGATNQITVQNNSAYSFTGTVVARQQASGGTQSAAWKIEGLIRREGTAASTTLVTSTVTVISNAPGWTLALSADTTNGALAITATGALATNIRWVATVQTSEITYA